jgi:oxygen-independent coproporphyrinogen III oxidase
MSETTGRAEPGTTVPSLYVHVPFCARKCLYCAFYSEPAGEELKTRYVRALLRELNATAPGPGLKTIFFGGGTPSLLSVRQWEKILQALQAHQLIGDAEFTVECNPATVDKEKAKLLRSFGVNRISMGVQSFDDELLTRLGRIHTRRMVYDSFEILRRAGFDNINLDLMFAIPGQTCGEWKATLDEALALQSEHLSTYEVIYEEDTPLYAELQAGNIKPDEELVCAMYDELLERATSARLDQYEVANFARHADAGATQRERGIPSRACLHNVNYWRGGAFVGLGPSATSYTKGVRSKNYANTQAYCEHLERGKLPIESREQLSPLGRAGETAAFGLRMTSGWSFKEFSAVTGFDLREHWADDLQRCVERGWGESDADGFRLTREGLRFADAAAEMFLR